MPFSNKEKWSKSILARDPYMQMLADIGVGDLVHLVSELGDNNSIGRLHDINGQKCINFGTCGYLGLDQDSRLKESACEYTRKFGIQFSVSRAHITSSINQELECLMSEIYGFPTLIQSSISLSHIANIPTLINEDDVIILDEQVHFSLQTGAQLAKAQGTKVCTLRHSDLDALEKKIIALKKRYNRVWYFIDGVYSMFGDVAPILEIEQLMVRHEQLNLYVDDAHSMSWHGRNGKGYIADMIDLNERIILVTGLCKGFGAVGGVTIFPTVDLCHRVKSFGGPTTFSHPLAPPIVGAAMASANIHLSDDIYLLQNELNEKVKHAYNLFAKSNLPIVYKIGINQNIISPIFFLGLSSIKAVQSLHRKLIDRGFFGGIAIYPAVAKNRAGIRFVITRHHELSDIESLINALEHYLPIVLKEANVTLATIASRYKVSVHSLSPLQKAISIS